MVPRRGVRTLRERFLLPTGVAFRRLQLLRAGPLIELHQERRTEVLKLGRSDLDARIPMIVVLFVLLAVVVLVPCRPVGMLVREGTRPTLALLFGSQQWLLHHQVHDGHRRQAVRDVCRNGRGEDHPSRRWYYLAKEQLCRPSSPGVHCPVLRGLASVTTKLWPPSVARARSPCDRVGVGWTGGRWYDGAATFWMIKIAPGAGVNTNQTRASRMDSISIRTVVLLLFYSAAAEYGARYRYRPTAKSPPHKSDAGHHC
uniref:Uncharacterized protein n=1 Tax=Anopheles atroparvus TaxID=41427 RepID=A0AAG5DJY3_ANOAO